MAFTGSTHPSTVFLQMKEICFLAGVLDLPGIWDEASPLVPNSQVLFSNVIPT